MPSISSIAAAPVARQDRLLRGVDLPKEARRDRGHPDADEILFGEVDLASGEFEPAREEPSWTRSRSSSNRAGSPTRRSSRPGGSPRRRVERATRPGDSPARSEPSGISAMVDATRAGTGSCRGPEPCRTPASVSPRAWSRPPGPRPRSRHRPDRASPARGRRGSAPPHRDPRREHEQTGHDPGDDDHDRIPVGGVGDSVWTGSIRGDSSRSGILPAGPPRVPCGNRSRPLRASWIGPIQTTPRTPRCPRGHHQGRPAPPQARRCRPGGNQSRSERVLHTWR